MKYSHNKLLKVLIDKRKTNTEMCKQAEISTNVLAKMGRCESVSMKSLAKVCTTLKCWLDDIVKIYSNTEKGGKE